ncbi:hypothetical protein J6590_060712 [Homalodisca vitripennis]|nr:hypothetical protein J6590_093410 [Homalodisca vitripennis]KAG8330560.1 hypothetical protein J6590_060712 [Homalodisca vitripennis]
METQWYSRGMYEGERWGMTENIVQSQKEWDNAARYLQTRRRADQAVGENTFTKYGRGFGGCLRGCTISWHRIWDDGFIHEEELGHYITKSSWKKGRPALNEPLQSKWAESGTPLLRLTRTSEVREQTPPTPTVISPPEAQHLRLVMCRYWTSIRWPRLKWHIGFCCAQWWIQLEGINQPEVIPTGYCVA